MKKVCVDAGHGGPDPGAVGGGGGLEEEDITLDVANRLAGFLQDAGVQVVRTRTDDTKWKNSRRVKVANDAMVDVFVSVHCNAAVSKKARGYEVVHYPDSLRGISLAKAVAASFSRNVKGIPARKPVTKDYTQLGRGPNFALTVIKDTLMPAIIVEIGFISSEQDRQEFDEEHERQEVAEAIGYGILGFLEIEQDKPNTPTNEKEDSGMNQLETDYFAAVEKERKVKEKDIKSIGKELSEVFQDGKLEPKEVPIMLRVTAKLIGAVIGMLGMFGVPPNVVGIVGIIGEVLKSLADGIEEQLPKIETAWAIVVGIVADKKINRTEIMPLLLAIADLMEAGLMIVLPFATPDFTDSMGALGNRVRSVVEFLEKIPGIGKLLGKSGDKKSSGPRAIPS